jgi:hypothetical protein
MKRPSSSVDAVREKLVSMFLTRRSCQECRAICIDDSALDRTGCDLGLCLGWGVNITNTNALIMITLLRVRAARKARCICISYEEG